jgi:DNA-directed RNA polymerase specialized sigma24 family protein
VGAFVLVRVRDPELAEEITSRVFEKVVQRHEQCRVSLLGWMWSIVRSEISRHFRQKGRTVSLGGDVLGGDGILGSEGAPSENLERAESRTTILQAIENLPESDRDGAEPWSDELRSGDFRDDTTRRSRR